ncbi:serine O-acetyltransferase [Anthocerotibacter panamensis]|uniref:serine O-acetyltransferase n=1 Tax=Anthocerotibacter panamensis TaxID=2857077 RepID=UPI001C403992|nr:serine acetyltransferase [Anthocerotibacter panamensis]
MRLCPEALWWWSCQAYRSNLAPLAQLLKTTNFFLFHTILPYQAQIESDIRLEHYGLGVVIHPNVKIGRRVLIHQHVTLAATTWVGSEHRIVIGDDVQIGAGAVVLTKENQSLFIGNGARIGANAVVTRDVLPSQTVVGVPARPLLPKSRTPEMPVLDSSST